MKLFKRESEFQKVFRDAEAACGDINREVSSALSKDMNKYAAEVASKNYLNPEGLALSIYENHWRHLSILLPKELEERLVNVLPPLSANHEQVVREFLKGYFERAKEGYLASREMRLARKGKKHTEHLNSFLNVVDSKISRCNARAQEALTRAIKTRAADFRQQRRQVRRELFYGIVIGAIGSLLAQWLWTFIT